MDARPFLDYVLPVLAELEHLLGHVDHGAHIAQIVGLFFQVSFAFICDCVLVVAVLFVQIVAGNNQELEPLVV